MSMGLNNIHILNTKQTLKIINLVLSSEWKQGLVLVESVAGAKFVLVFSSHTFTTCLSFFFSFVRKYFDRSNLREKWFISVQDPVHHDRGGKAAGVRSSWSHHIHSEKNRVVACAAAQLPFSTYGVQDLSQWAGLLTSINVIK